MLALRNVPAAIQPQTPNNALQRTATGVPVFSDLFVLPRRCLSLSLDSLGTSHTDMAQWSGQYLGHTHDTKVDEAEELLREAITALSSAPASYRARRVKSVRRLADRLLAARLKVVRAKLSVRAEPDQRGGEAEQSTRLLAREQELVAGGVASILREFNVAESASSSASA